MSESESANSNAKRAAELAQFQDRAARAENVKAQEQIDAFIAEATSKGIRPEPLMAKGYDGTSRAKTPHVGWYLRTNHSVAVGTGGEFYVLVTGLSFWDRFRTVTINPTPPPLVVGRGARDGESFDLQELLNLRLSAGNNG